MTQKNPLQFHSFIIHFQHTNIPWPCSLFQKLGWYLKSDTRRVWCCYQLVQIELLPHEESIAGCAWKSEVKEGWVSHGLTYKVPNIAQVLLPNIKVALLRVVTCNIYWHHLNFTGEFHIDLMLDGRFIMPQNTCLHHRGDLLKSIKRCSCLSSVHHSCDTWFV